jgi:hypothetical protein
MNYRIAANSYIRPGISLGQEGQNNDRRKLEQKLREQQDKIDASRRYLESSLNNAKIEEEKEKIESASKNIEDLTKQLNELTVTRHEPSAKAFTKPSEESEDYDSFRFSEEGRPSNSFGILDINNLPENEKQVKELTEQLGRLSLGGKSKRTTKRNRKNNKRKTIQKRKHKKTNKKNKKAKKQSKRKN